MDNVILNTSANSLESLLISSPNNRIAKNLTAEFKSYEEQLKSAFEEYQDYLHKRNDTIKSDDESEDFWLQRKKRMKKLLEMQQEMFENFQELKQLSDHKAEVKAVQMKAEGLVDTSNPMPVIVGIPAKFLLSMLSADSTV